MADYDPRYYNASAHNNDPPRKPRGLLLPLVMLGFLGVNIVEYFEARDSYVQENSYVSRYEDSDLLSLASFPGREVARYQYEQGKFDGLAYKMKD